jgi:hypothetical protein
VHRKDGKPDSLRITYHVAGHQWPTVAEWLCCWHPGFIGMRARNEWRRRLSPDAPRYVPDNAAQAATVAASRLRRPPSVHVWNERGFTRVLAVFDPAQAMLAEGAVP